MTKNTSARHARNGIDAQAPSRLDLKSRLGAGAVAGCLALTLCPAIAFAAPGGEGPQQEGNPPAMQQEAQPGQAQGAPEGPGNRDRQDNPTSQQGQPPQQGQMPEQGQLPDSPMAPSQQPTAWDSAPADGQQPPAQSEGQGQSAPDSANRDNSGFQPFEGEAPANGQEPPAGEFGQGNGGMSPSGEAPQQQDADRKQMPQGSFPADDETSGQIRRILAEEFDMSAPADAQPGQNGASAPGAPQNQPGAAQGQTNAKPDQAPDIPEGETNVQQVIDTIRDVLLHYDAKTLAEKLSDADFAAEVQAYAKTATAQRFTRAEGTPADADGSAGAERADAASQTPPSDQAADDATAPAAQEAGAKPAQDQGREQTADTSLLSTIANLVMGAFGFTSAA